MTVLSLFDGLSGGRIALQRANIGVTRYYSSEIDKYAIKIADKNHPQDSAYRLGDVTKWREWDIDWSSIDLLLAGFPCQAWSLAGQQGGDSDPRGALMHDLIAIWRHIESLNPLVPSARCRAASFLRRSSQGTHLNSACPASFRWSVEFLQTPQ